MTGINSLIGSPKAGSTSIFPWLSIALTVLRRSCDTRDVVLKRDGKNVVQSSSTCSATSGTWCSPYDGASWTDSSDVDIDHLVPLSNAWKVWNVKYRNEFSLKMSSLARLNGPPLSDKPLPTI